MTCRMVFLTAATLAAYPGLAGTGTAQAPARTSREPARETPATTIEPSAPEAAMPASTNLTLEIHQQKPDYVEWVSTITLGVPQAVTFRWSRPSAPEDLAGGAGSPALAAITTKAQWQLSLAAAPTASVTFLGTGGRSPLWTSYGAVSVPAIGSSAQFTLPAATFPAKPPAGVAWVRVVLSRSDRLRASPWRRITFVERSPMALFDEPLDRCRESPDGYYRLPFGPGSHWKLFKGNWDDPTRGHNKGNAGGLQAYAFDFVYDSDADGKGEVGQTVRAARRGRVHALIETESGNSWGDGTPAGYEGVGNFLVIRHPDGTFGTYWHLVQNSIGVSVGQVVERGQAIAKVGNTGNSSMPHVHFDVRTDWSLDYPEEREEFPSVTIRFQDEDNTCWIPRVGDAFDSNNQ